MNYTDKNIASGTLDFNSLIEKYFVENEKNEEYFRAIYIALARTLIPKFSKFLNTNVITAEDIYNETWFAILNPATACYDCKLGPFIGYFYSISKNQIHNWNFKKETTESVSIDKIKEDILQEMEPNRDLLNNELKLIFYQEINKLQPIQREIIMFRNLGFQYSEISNIMNASEDALRQRMNSAKKHIQLSTELKELLFD